MGISALTGLEIFTQPDDLEFSVPKAKVGGKFGILITRGPGHNFKLLVSGDPILDTREAAIEIIKGGLQDILIKSEQTLTNPSDFLRGLINPENLPLAQMNVLTQERIDWIIKELAAHGIASTYKLVATPG